MQDNIELTKNYLYILLTILTILSILASSVIAYALTNDAVQRHNEDIKQLKQDSVECKLISSVIPRIEEDIKEIKADVKQLIKRD
jgi:peptidoglycan hydrolase CwlO-like protein